MSSKRSKSNGHTDVRTLIEGEDGGEIHGESASDRAVAQMISALAKVVETQGAEIVTGARNYLETKLDLDKQRLDNERARIDKELEIKKDEGKDQRGLTTRAVVLYSIIAIVVVVGLVVLGLKGALSENVLSAAVGVVVTGVFVTLLRSGRS